MSRSFDSQNLLVFTPETDNLYEEEIENIEEGIVKEGYKYNEINFMLCERVERRIFSYWLVVSNATEQKVAELLPVYERTMGENYDENWAKKDVLKFIDRHYVYDEKNKTYQLAGNINVEQEIREHAKYFWPENYKGILTDEEVDYLTRCSETRALTKSGEIPLTSTLMARLAYIATLRGERVVHQVEKAYMEVDDENESSRIVKNVFVETHAKARAVWGKEHDGQLKAERMPGKIMRAIRKTMGINQEEFANLLNVSPRSVRAWEAGEKVANQGVTADVWKIWENWKQETLAKIPEDEIAVYDENIDTETLQVALLFKDRVTIQPKPLYATCAEELGLN